MNALEKDQDAEFLRTLSLLYVEDEEEVRRELTRFLSRRFAKVDVAANGQEGLELAFDEWLSGTPGVASCTRVKSPVSGETMPTAPSLIFGSSVQLPQ